MDQELWRNELFRLCMGKQWRLKGAEDCQCERQANTQSKAIEIRLNYEQEVTEDSKEWVTAHHLSFRFFLDVVNNVTDKTVGDLTSDPAFCTMRKSWMVFNVGVEIIDRQNGFLFIPRIFHGRHFVREDHGWQWKGDRGKFDCSKL